jgi:hypothetical protein
MSPSPIHIFGGHCVAQDVILGLGATFALYVRASPIVTLVALQEVAVENVAAGCVEVTSECQAFVPLCLAPSLKEAGSLGAHGGFTFFASFSLALS